MSDSKEKKKVAEANDPELDELLDSALADLVKKDETNEATEKQKEGAETKEDDESKEWSEEFVKQAAAQFESNMSNLLGNMSGTDPADVTPEQIQQNLQRMAEAAAQVMSNPQGLEQTSQSNDFASTITQTLQGLSLGAENLQNPFSEQDLVNMFGNLGSGGPGAGGDEPNAFLPFMQGMMQSLLSKDVLYPSLKDILDRYPAWLEDNKSTLEASELERYTKQKDLMQSVCDELEIEQDSDTDAVKRERFDKVLTLMQKMQDLGHPPTELVGDAGPGLQFDPLGNLNLPDMNGPIDPNQCTAM